VADIGTAATIDVVAADGRHRGGYIVPGPRLMVGSLLQGTSDLASFRASSPPGSGAAFADNTRDAIISGCLHAQVGAIAQAQAAMPGAYCLLSGGAAPHIAPHLTVPFEQVDQLVLLGLDVAARAEVV
jgi:type III pantothenate kinase